MFLATKFGYIINILKANKIASSKLDFWIFLNIIFDEKASLQD